MPHTNYYEITAYNHYDLGVQQGEMFAEDLRESVDELRADFAWKTRRKAANAHLAITQKNFPHLIDELEGCADGAHIAFDDLWVLSTESEYPEAKIDRCTTVVTNHGALVAHNEDWEPDVEDGICVLRKTVGELTILELSYPGTLGGNSISVNSYGYIQAVNTLSHTDHQIGIPRNIVARWLSETKSPEKDYQRLCTMRRAGGYSHTFVSFGGKVWNMECSAAKQKLTQPKLPFVHTNHFLTELRTLEDTDNSCGTMNRYRRAAARVKKSMSVCAARELMSDTSEDEILSIFNERTIARVIIDLEARKMHTWLLREAKKGWVPYDLESVKR